MRFSRLTSLAILVLVSCRAPESPVAPAAPSDSTQLPSGAVLTQGTVLRFVSGENQRPVTDANVLLGGRSYQTDAAGQVVLGEDLPVPAPVDVSSPSYVLRQTMLRNPGDTTLTLWPRTSPTGFTDDWTRWVLYTPAVGGAPGESPLHRLNATRVSVVPSADLQKDAEAMNAHAWAASLLTDATEGAVVFAVESEPTSPVVFRTMIDGKDPAMKSYAALAYRNVSGYGISGGRLVFASMGAARLHAVVAHELGHVFGLEHSPDEGDLMHAIVPPRKGLSARERLAMQLILGRRGGNRYPDDDRGVSIQAGRQTLLTPCGAAAP